MNTCLGDGVGYLGRCSLLLFDNSRLHLFIATRSHGHGAHTPYRGHCR